MAAGSSLGARNQDQKGPSRGSRAGPHSQACPTAPAGDSRGHSSPSIGHLPGAEDKPRLGWDAGPQVGQARRCPRPEKAVGSWSPALLQRRWGKDSQSWGAEMGSWALGRMGKGSGEAKQGL